MSDSGVLSLLKHSNLLEVFGQRDAARRYEAMGRTYAKDISFTDPEGTVHGFEAVDRQVHKVLAEAPESFRFRAGRAPLRSRRHKGSPAVGIRTHRGPTSGPGC
jgi:hypothetical protein